jgi:hypothetical protein
MMPLPEIFCLVDRRFSRQKRKLRTPRTSAPNGIPIANPTVEATVNGVDGFGGAFFAEDDELLAEEGVEDIPFAFFRLRTSLSKP